MSMSTVKRITKLDNVKWVLTLLIVLYHISYYGNKGIEEEVYKFIQNLGDCVVPAFAIISGFLFWVNVKDFSDVKSKVRRRVATLLVPYLVWNLINTIGLNFWNYRSFKEEVFDVNLWSEIVKWNSSPHFWYIFMLIFWTAFSPVLYLAYKDKRILVLLLLSQFIYLIYKGDEIFHSRFIYMIYTWGGYLGYTRPDMWNKLTSLEGKKKGAMGFLALFLYLLLCVVIAFVDIPMSIRVWLYAIKGGALILFVINLPPFRIGRITNYKYSFWIFAVHYWLDHYVGIYIGKYIYGIIGSGIVWLLVFIMALSSGMLLNRFCPCVFNVLNGSRANK